MAISLMVFYAEIEKTPQLRSLMPINVGSHMICIVPPSLECSRHIDT
jgi:hypothetical protein